MCQSPGYSTISKPLLLLFSASHFVAYHTMRRKQYETQCSVNFVLNLDFIVKKGKIKFTFTKVSQNQFFDH